MNIQILDKMENNNKNILVKDSQEQVIIDVVKKYDDTDINTRIKVEKNAKLVYITLLTDDSDIDYKENRIVELAKNANATMLYCYLGNQNIDVAIHNKIGQDANLQHKVLFFASDNQLLQFQEKHEFLKSNGIGNLSTYGFLNNNAKGSCNSLIKINPYAQKVDSRLDLHSYILGQDAKSIMVPSLQIEANDVKAGHGATVSHIDQESLFYLMSRGLSEKEAMHLFVDGLFNDFISEFDHKETKNLILSLLQKKYSL